MKLGFLSLPLAGHLNPMMALARKLQARGDEPIFFGIPDCGPAAAAAGLQFVSYAEEEYPRGSVARIWGPIASMHGIEVMRYAMGTIHPPFLETAYCRLPGKLREAGVEAVVLDAAFEKVELVALSLGLPYVQIWNILPPDYTDATPPIVLSLPYEDTPEARARNRAGLQEFGGLFAAVQPVVQAYARQSGLEIDWSNPGATASNLAILAQCPKEFELPGVPRPPYFHYTGPFSDGAGREPIPFPWDRLDGRPLVYASLGTLVNDHPQLHRAILGAAAEMPEIQMVFSVGGNSTPEELGLIPANAVLVPHAPQGELLKRAALCITHGGLNTTLDALAEAVPLVAVPIGYDQPGVATRIAHHGVGEFLTLDRATPENLLALMKQVLGQPGYRDKARAMQHTIAQAKGLDRAAELVRQAFGR